MNKMTPTPWHYSWDDNGFFFIDASGRPSPYIVATGTGCDPGSVCEANAEAIVSAVNNTYGAAIRPEATPDLLKCAKELMRFSNQMERWADNLQYPDNFLGAIASMRSAIEQSKL